MIVADLGDRYRFITQPDHAELAGQFADRWGGAAARPDPFDSLAVAAYLHDAGWTDYDRRPRLDDDGEPVDFRGMPADPWIPLYEDGIEAVVDLDTYAGLLVSLHGAGLRNRRYGLSPEWPETPPAFEEFVEREQRRQRRLLDDLPRDDPECPVSPADEATLEAMHDPDRTPENPDGRLWDDYRRLQAWDALSLSFCLTDSPPGYGSVGPVPGADGTDETLSIARVESDGDGTEADEPPGAGVDGEFRVDPYPFDTAPLVVGVPVRTVAKSAVGDPSTLARVYYGAGRRTETFRLRPPD